MTHTLTKFEKARVLGIRSLQLSCGAPPMVDTTGIRDVMKIAEKELRENKMPLIIKRPYPDGTYIEIKVSNMIIDD